MNHRHAGCVLVAMTLLACTVDEGEPVGVVDEAAILSRLESRAYLADGFYRVNRVPYETATAGSPINVWVSEWALAGFSAVAPEDDSAAADIPEDAMIVREVLDNDANVTKLTVMVKGPPGYNPGGGDFWFGVTDARGVPALDVDGAPLLGRLEAECGGCHLSRSSSGYLFGVPADNRRPSAQH